MAQLLLKKAEELAIECNFKYIRIDTNEINVKMRGLLEKLEYCYVGSIALNACEGLMFACYEKKV